MAMKIPAKPSVMSKSGKREFACYPVAVLVIVLDDFDRVLLLCHPKRPGCWEVVNGALEADETVLEGLMRESREELGSDVRIRPIAAVHAQSFAYDNAVRKMISLVFVAAYEGGTVRPGDDMAGSTIKWVGVAEIVAGEIDVIVPRGQTWLFSRALELYRLWKADPVDLQIELTPHKK